MPEEQANNRNPDGTFKPGVSGNPGGRPVGSISIVGMIRRKFEENPEYALEWVDQLLADPSNRKAVMEQIDGKPRQHDAYQNDIGAYAFTDAPTWDQLRQAIYQNKVVLALVDCFNTWYTPSWAEKDILPLKIGNFVGHHFIGLHSYDEQYIYFRNSWSNAWGRNGDGYFDQTYLPHVLEIGTAIDLPAPFIFTNYLSQGVTSNDVLQLQKRLNANPATEVAARASLNTSV